MLAPTYKYPWHLIMLRRKKFFLSAKNKMNFTAFETAYLKRIETIAQAEEINLQVANALRFVIRNIFANISNTLVMTTSTDKGPVEFWLHDILAKLLLKWEFMAIQLVVLEHITKALHVPGKRYCNMIMIDSMASLLKTNIAEYNRKSDTMEYYFIFLQMPDIVIAKEMKNVFKYCFDNYWLHCNIMVQNAKGEILIYTYFPFEENKCFQTEAQLINRFNRNSFENAIMFPDKLKNLNRCALKLSTWEVPPFVIKATNKEDPQVPVSGFEVLALISISHHMNFTLDVEWISQNTYTNDSSVIGPLTRVSRQYLITFQYQLQLFYFQLNNKETNITMGYFRRTAARDEMATPSIVTYNIPIVGIVLRKPKKNIALGMIAYPFDNTTWIIMLIVYATIGIQNCFGNACGKGGILLVFEIIIGISVKNLPKANAIRISFLTLVLSAFIFRSFYQSLLFFLFRSNYYQAIPTALEDLAANGYKALVTALSMQFMHHVPQIANKSLTTIVFDTTDDMILLRYLYEHGSESLVAMSIEEFAMRFVREELPPGNALFIMPMNVKDQQIAFYYLKHSYLGERFDIYFGYFQQAGLLVKWREWTISNYQISQIRSSASNADAIMVSMKQLLGFLLLIGLMNTTALLLFGLELLSRKYLYLQRAFARLF